MKLNITKNTKIYILCPPKYATGGTELLHQLCNELNNLNFKAYIYYHPFKNPPTANRFKVYNINIARKIEDSNENLFIGSEIDNFTLFKYKKIQKIVWWLSVDNHFKNKDLRNNNLKIKLKDFLYKRKCFDFDYHDSNSVTHFAQSEYAVEFLKKNNVKNIYYLSDYLNEIFLNSKTKFKNKNDFIIYNPKKGLNIVNKLKEKSKNINWIPIINMTHFQVLKLLKSSKIYIDFGNHPGKDRFPREAAISGCCIFTNLQGSAKNLIDVQIPPEFKLDTELISESEILEKIKKCLIDYDSEVLNFEKYRNIIVGEKEDFKKDVINIFCKNKCI